MSCGRNVAISALQGAAFAGIIYMGVGTLLSQIPCMGYGAILGIQAENTRNYTDYNNYFTLEGYVVCSIGCSMIVGAVGALGGAVLGTIQGVFNEIFSCCVREEE